MIKIKILKFLFPALAAVAPIHSESGIVQANGMDLWYEAFGQKENPVFLLIMGAGGQGIIWPTQFCQDLADKGFYVIRYDLRDAGLSTCVDFAESPYTILDLAKDAIGLLDALKIEKAHLFGLSMGGGIAEFMAVHFPERVLSIAFLGMHFDYRPYNLANAGLPAEPGNLSAPQAEFLKKAEILMQPADTEEEKVEQMIKRWQLLNGSAFPLEETSLRALHREFIARSVHPENLRNYRKVILASEEMIRSIHSQVQVPTIIFQGTLDPVLGVDHAEAMGKAIRNSKVYIVDGLGHLLNPHFYPFFIEKLSERTISTK